MRSRIRQIKTLDPSARVLGLDVGRKYTGRRPIGSLAAVCQTPKDNKLAN